MDHVVDYIVKGSRPKKPIVILWGSSLEMARLFKRSTDLYAETLHPGSVKAHASNLPLFSESATLWVNGIPDMPFLKSLCQGDIAQPVIFECVTKEDPPEIEGTLKTKIKMLSLASIKVGSTSHRNIIKWYIHREFPDLDEDILDCLCDITSQHFSPNILHSLDSLAQRLYLFPQDALTSTANLKRYSMKIPPEHWPLMLQPPDKAVINGVITKIFEKSRTAYVYLNTYYDTYDSPLPLLKALADVVEKYLECCWAIRETKGHDQSDPQAFVQGRRIPRYMYNNYNEKISRFFGEKILWAMAKEISITQAKYRTGVTSKLPLYTLLGRYIGSGI